MINGFRSVHRSLSCICVLFIISWFLSAVVNEGPGEKNINEVIILFEH